MNIELLSLTRRELDICAHLSTGKGNREISRILEIKECTVKAHISKVLKKNSLKNRTELTYLLTDNQEKNSILQETDLTQREHQIAQYMVKGYLNKEISYELNIKLSTVKKHASRILKKLNLANRTELTNQFH